MLPLFHHAVRLRRLPLATLALLSFLGPASHAAATDVLVVTDAHHPVRAARDARIIELDLPARIEAELARALPPDPARATEIAQQRIRQGGAALQRRISNAYQGVADARSLGIATIPAVIVDRRYVIYGETDVARAVARIAAYRKTQP